MAEGYEIRKDSDDGPYVVYRCPNCGRSIESLLSEAGATDKCPGCGRAVTVPGQAERQLSDRAEREETARQKVAGNFTAEWILHTAVEAQLAMDALDDAGIPYLSEDFMKSPWDGALANQYGWGRILVRENDRERATQIIQDALQPAPLDDAEDQPGYEKEAEPDAD